MNNPITFLILKFIPYITLWIFFTMLYLFLPNTRVKIKAGLIGGIVAGSLYQITQYAYMTFQVFTTKYNAIYGSFAALPLFLIWLQLSWLIVLLGAEVSFAVQNVQTYEFEPESEHVNYSLKKRIVLRIMKLCVDCFCAGKPALSANDISRELDIPIRLVRQLLFELVQINLLSEIKTDDEQVSAFQPARTVEDITVHGVISEFEKFGIGDLPMKPTDISVKLDKCLNEFDELIKNAPANIALIKI